MLDMAKKSTGKKVGRPRMNEEAKKPIAFALRPDTVERIRSLAARTQRSVSVEAQVAFDFYFAYLDKHKMTLPVDLAK